jgi:hypothetical protein
MIFRRSFKTPFTPACDELSRVVCDFCKALRPPSAGLKTRAKALKQFKILSRQGGTKRLVTKDRKMAQKEVLKPLLF